MSERPSMSEAERTKERGRELTEQLRAAEESTDAPAMDSAVVPIPADASDRRCPLCQTGGCEQVRGADDRSYYRCGCCLLIFADARHRLSRAEEAAHYRTHENGIHQRGYVEFLGRVIEPMLPYLRPSMRGLDFGCGPGPTLSLLVRRRGIACEDYDPIFRDVPLNPPYDFLFATECFEHFFSPARELERIRGLLCLGGLLGIMTELWTDVPSFGAWYYTRDPTHVSFFHERTIDFICSCYGFERLWFDGRRVIVLRYNGDPGGKVERCRSA